MAGCESDSGPVGVPKGLPVGGHVTFGVLGEPPTLNPYGGDASDLTYFLARPVYRSLGRVMPDGVVESDLVDFGDAANFTPVKDGLIVDLERARWSDGSPVTAVDVVRSVELAREPSGFVGLKATAVGRRRVRFRGDVFGDWARRLAVGTYVVPRGRALGVGAGPFIIDRYVPGLEISYVPNPEWTGDDPFLDRITVKFISSLEIMLQLLEDGRLDAAAVPSAVNIDERLEEYGVVYDSIRGREVILLDFASELGRSLKPAIWEAIDRDVIDKGLIRDEGFRIRFEPRLRDTSVSPGTEIQLGTAAGDELLTMIQKVVQRQLEDEIQSELVTMDPATFYGPWDSTGPLDVALRREIVAGFDYPPHPTGPRKFALFVVESFLAWNEGVIGLEPHGGLEGPLWNAEVWAKQ